MLRCLHVVASYPTNTQRVSLCQATRAAFARGEHTFKSNLHGSFFYRSEIRWHVFPDSPFEGCHRNRALRSNIHHVIQLCFNFSGLCVEFFLGSPLSIKLGEEKAVYTGESNAAFLRNPCLAASRRIFYNLLCHLHRNACTKFKSNNLLSPFLKEFAAE